MALDDAVRSLSAYLTSCTSRDLVVVEGTAPNHGLADVPQSGIGWEAELVETTSNQSMQHHPQKSETFNPQPCTPKPIITPNPERVLWMATDL